MAHLRSGATDEANEVLHNIESVRHEIATLRVKSVSLEIQETREEVLDLCLMNLSTRIAELKDNLLALPIEGVRKSIVSIEDVLKAQEAPLSHPKISAILQLLRQLQEKRVEHDMQSMRGQWHENRSNSSSFQLQQQQLRGLREYCKQQSWWTTQLEEFFKIQLLQPLSEEEEGIPPPEVIVPDSSHVQKLLNTMAFLWKACGVEFVFIPTAWFKFGKTSETPLMYAQTLNDELYHRTLLCQRDRDRFLFCRDKWHSKDNVIVDAVPPTEDELPMFFISAKPFSLDNYKRLLHIMERRRVGVSAELQSHGNTTELDLMSFLSEEEVLWCEECLKNSLLYDNGDFTEATFFLDKDELDSPNYQLLPYIHSGIHTKYVKYPKDKPTEDDSLNLSFWRSIHLTEKLGATVPTWKQWEAAARGTEGYIFPWGDDFNENEVYYDSIVDNWTVTPLPQLHLPETEQSKVNGSFKRVSSLGKYAACTSPFGLTKLCSLGVEWNTVNIDMDNGQALFRVSSKGDYPSSHCIRSLSDHTTNYILPTSNTNSNDINQTHQSRNYRAFSGPICASFSRPNENSKIARFRLVYSINPNNYTSASSSTLYPQPTREECSGTTAEEETTVVGGRVGGEGKASNNSLRVNTTDVYLNVQKIMQLIGKSELSMLNLLGKADEKRPHFPSGWQWCYFSCGIQLQSADTYEKDVDLIQLWNGDTGIVDDWHVYEGDLLDAHMKWCDVSVDALKDKYTHTTIEKEDDDHRTVLVTIEQCEEFPGVVFEFTFWGDTPKWVLIKRATTFPPAVDTE